MTLTEIQKRQTRLEWAKRSIIPCALLLLLVCGGLTWFHVISVAAAIAALFAVVFAAMLAWYVARLSQQSLAINSLVIKSGKAHVPAVLRALDTMVNGTRYLGENAEVVKEEVRITQFSGVELYERCASVWLLCRSKNSVWFRLNSIVNIWDSTFDHRVEPITDQQARRELSDDLTLYKKHFGAPTSA
jgi:hypothetical protein